MIPPIKRVADNLALEQPGAKKKLTKIEDLSLRTLGEPDFSEWLDSLPDYTSSSKKVFEVKEVMTAESALAQRLFGQFRVVYPNQEYYEGDFANGLPHGKGKSYWNNGALNFEGTYCKGILQGSGIEYWPNGRVKYKGRLQNNVYYGFGVYFDEDGKPLHNGYWIKGCRYLGEMKKRKPNGIGALYCLSGTLLLSGNWYNGEMYGEGVAYQANGKVMYRGNWVSGFMHGFGTEYDSSGNAIAGRWYCGNRYEGEWKDGKPHGVGAFYYPGGAVMFQGQLKLGKCEGNGKHFRQDGALYEGEFKNGSYGGSGTLYGADGTIIHKGRWVKGVFQES